MASAAPAVEQSAQSRVWLPSRVREKSPLLKTDPETWRALYIDMSWSGS